MSKLLVAVKASEECWPGFRPLSAPVLLVKDAESAILVDHPRSPAGFSKARFSGVKVSVSKSPPAIGSLFRRQYALGGVPVTAVSYDDRQPSSTTVAIAIHEHFHDFQATWKVQFHDSKYRTKDVDDLAMATVEQECLAGALESRSAEDIRCFLALRMRRYERAPVAAVERDQERGEGTARYVDSVGRARAFGGDEGLPRLIRSLRRPPTADQMGNRRSYLTGAGLCYILSRERPGAWQTEIEKGEGPYDLLAKLHPLTRAEADRIALALLKSPAFAKALVGSRKEIARWRKQRETSISRFKEASGIHVRLMTSRLKNADKLDTYFTSTGEEIEVDGGKMLMQDVATLRSKAPGWDCELKNRALIFGQDIEFVAAPVTHMQMDGRPWTPAIGLTDFQTFELKDPGASVVVSDGHARFDGRVLEISQ